VNTDLEMPEQKQNSRSFNFYEQFGFIKLERDYQEDELLKFIRILQEDELIEKNETQETE